MSNNESELLDWVGALESLGDDKKVLDKFEKEMSKLVEFELDRLHKTINASLKKIDSETGSNWSAYLDDFEVYDWHPGDFQETIRDWLKGKIKEEASKLD